MVFWQILVDGFAISSLYALGATGFALIFGVSGVLNLSHGALMVAAVVAAWAAGNDLHVGPYAGATLGVAVGFAATLLTYFIIVRPLQQTRKIREEEKEIFILTATLLWGIMIQELIAYLYTNNAKTVAPIVNGVISIVGVRTPQNEIFTAVVCWLVIGGAVASGEPHPRRQGGARGLDESARRDAARHRIVASLYRRLGDLRRAGRHCRRAARHVPRRVVL